MIVLILNISDLEAQVQPKEDAVLNFTQVLLEVPEVKGAINYQFKVIEEGGNFLTPIISQNDPSQVTIISDLEFGKKYQWMTAAFDDKKLISKTEIFHFKIGESPFVDTTKQRFQIVKDFPDEYQDGVIFLDYSGVAINRKGKPVWYLPKTEGVRVGRDRIRDLRLTSAGTVTFNAMQLCREISVDGITLWETPSDNGLLSKDVREFYHHEFSRLESGNYMALALTNHPQELILNNQKIDKIPMSVIVEYNREGDTVWTWSAKNYISDSDILSLTKNGYIGHTLGHMNSTFTDLKKDELYVSFRDFNTIIVVDKKTRKVVRSYGDKIPSDTTVMANGFFKKQHAPIIMPDGKIILFNNGEEGKDEISKIVIFTEPYLPLDSSRIDWEFQCDFDTLTSGFVPRMGNVQPIDLNHFLVNMGTVGRLFEVTRNKKVVWDCLPEIWNEASAEWKWQPNYKLDYATSLYPCYFSFSVQQKEPEIIPVLSIVNEGSEADEYVIKIIPGNNEKKAHYINTGIQKQSETIAYPINMFGKKALKKGYTIEVQSNNNKQLVKRKTYN